MVSVPEMNLVGSFRVAELIWSMKPTTDKTLPFSVAIHGITGGYSIWLDCLFQYNGME